MMVPAPRQTGQVTAIWKNPWDWRTWPAPPHWRQVSGGWPGSAPVPLQSSQRTKRGMVRSTVVPRAASRKETFRL